MEENRLKNGHSLVDQIQSVMKTDPDFPQKFKQRLLIESYQVTNPFQFISTLFSKGALGDGSSDKEEFFALKEMIIQLAIRMACSRGTDAIVGLVETLEESGNLLFSEAIRTWFEDNFTIGANGDLSESKKENALVRAPRSEILRKEVKQPTTEESKLVGPEFLYQNVPPNELLKVATFNDQPESSADRTYALHLGKNRMAAGFADGTVKMWNWINNEEKSFKCGNNAIKCIQYDEEIIVLGTSGGIVYLYDAVTLEEKWSVRFGASVDSLKFFETTLVVFAGAYDDKKLWWFDISRSDMRLLNQRTIGTSKWQGESRRGAVIDSTHCFFYVKNSVYLYNTKLGLSITDTEGDLSCLSAPADISALTLVDLISTKKVLIAGCVDGSIVVWNTVGKISVKQSPIKTFKHYSDRICHLFNINGHLISKDVKSRVLMWSGHDLENESVMAPIPRFLVDFPDYFLLAEHERWFACSTLNNGNIDIWAFPDLWLRTG